jgi:hypothetical protein
MSAYRHLVNRATDEHVRRLSPPDTALHDQWLGAVAERSPAASGMAKVLVELLREQTKSSILVTDVDLVVSCDGYEIRRHLFALFNAGLISARHRFPSPHKIRLCLP